MVRRSGAQTLTLHVHRDLRADIVGGRLEPGAKLSPTTLAARFEVSVAVVREALARLAAEGLVHVAHNRGFQVAPVSEQALRELTEVRRLNEGHAVRLSVRRGDIAWESEVLAAHHLLERTPGFSADDPDHRTDEWAAAHQRFHAALRAACGNEMLLEICHRLSDAGELYRSLTHPQPREVVGAHRELLEAALARDADRAATLAERHIQWTADMLLDGPLRDTPATGSPTGDVEIG